MCGRFVATYTEIIFTELPEHGHRGKEGAHTVNWSGRGWESALRVVYLNNIWINPLAKVSNEEGTGTVGPRRVNLLGWRLSGLRVGCCSLRLTTSSRCGAICLFLLIVWIFASVSVSQISCSRFTCICFCSLSIHMPQELAIIISQIPQIN